MTKVTASGYTQEAAIKILKRFYEADKSAGYLGPFCVKGPNIEAQLSATKRSVAVAPVYTITVKSSTWEKSTIEDLINDAVKDLPVG